MAVSSVAGITDVGTVFGPVQAEENNIKITAMVSK
jgi:hypothetical protein